MNDSLKFTDKKIKEVEKDIATLDDDMKKIFTYLDNAKDKKKLTEDQIIQLESDLKILQAKTKEELKISPENESKIKELNEIKSDLELELKDLNEKLDTEQ